MIIDRTHRVWFMASMIVFIAASVSYVFYASAAPNGPTGGSLMGLLYGIAGTALMLFAGLLAARKRVPTWRIGSAQFWLRGHIWLGLLSVPLILFHTGFGWGGTLEVVLCVSFAVVVVSGLFGLAVQQVLPRYLTSRVSLETFGPQIDYLCQRMLFQADKLVSDRCGRLDVDCESFRPVFGPLAKQAKNRRWIRKEADLPKLLAEMYTNCSISKPETSAQATSAKDRAAKVEPDLSVSNRTLPGAANAAENHTTAMAAVGSEQPAVKVELASTATAVKLPNVTSSSAKTGNEKHSVADSPAQASQSKPLGKPTKPVAAKTQSAAARKNGPIPRADELLRFYVTEVRPFLEGTSRSAGRLDVDSQSNRLFARMRATLPALLHDTLDRLAAACEERRQFDVQRRIHRSLHWWLILHIPATIALLVLLVAHVLTALRVVPFSN